MLKTQTLLNKLAKKSKGKYDPLTRLAKHYGINLTYNENDNRVILSYDQIDSQKHKYSPIVKECRGLTLDKTDFSLCSYGMNRFYNYMESREEFNRFDWTNFTVETKEDGSIIFLYYWNGGWRINTRGSFGDGDCNTGKVPLLEPKTWRELVLELLPLERIERLCSKNETYSLELCSLWNKNVRHYRKPMLSLLMGRNKNHLKELGDIYLDDFASDLGVQRPQRYNFKSVEECQDYLDKQEDATFEGFVLKDVNNNRIKLKSSRFISLHHLKDNGNICNMNRLVPLILAGEADEVKAIFPELKERIDEVEEKLLKAYGELAVLYANNWQIVSQKEFALRIIKHPLAGILFNLRKRQDAPLGFKMPYVGLDEVWKESADLIIKKLF